MTEQTFNWSDITTLVPTQIGKKTALPPHYTLRVVTIVGIKTTVGRFMPVSHEGESNETYIDKVDLLGAQRAEFIARKIKAIERRQHMRLFRELTEKHTKKSWDDAFKSWFKLSCEIPDGQCTLCWQRCDLFPRPLL